MHEHIGNGKGIYGEIAGTITWIAADNYIKTGFPELSGILRCPPLQSCGKLEGKLLCPPFM
jgi:hypothetical protein